jgi:hypothetical protein
MLNRCWIVSRMTRCRGEPASASTVMPRILSQAGSSPTSSATSGDGWTVAPCSSAPEGPMADFILVVALFVLTMFVVLGLHIVAGGGITVW